jgi:hypothetical protein
MKFNSNTIFRTVVLILVVILALFYFADRSPSFQGKALCGVERPCTFQDLKQAWFGWWN